MIESKPYALLIPLKPVTFTLKINFARFCWSSERKKIESKQLIAFFHGAVADFLRYALTLLISHTFVIRPNIQ